MCTLAWKFRYLLDLARLCVRRLYGLYLTLYPCSSLASAQEESKRVLEIPYTQLLIVYRTFIVRKTTEKQNTQRYKMESADLDKEQAIRTYSIVGIINV